MKEIKISASPNIAFMKYWGKKETLGDEDRNMPLNPSLSLTLSKAKTQVHLSEAKSFEFLVQHELAADKDREKIQAHIGRIEVFLDKKLSPFRMDSYNNFPTGTGIASSASSFAALTCAFLAWELGEESVRSLLQNEPQRIAALARRGSGSACRSLHGPFVEWSEKSIQIHKSDWKLFDTILIFSKKEKSVSSSEGHKFATLSPLFPERLKKLPARLAAMKAAINEKNLAQLGPLLELEAEEMHTIMRENPHPIEYQLPETKHFLRELKALPQRDFYFTLDAGPNAHIISERPIHKELSELLEKHKINAEIWEDQTGMGPSFS